MAVLKRRSDCPISSSLEVWGDKWSLLIVRDLFYKKQCSYSEFLKSEEKIATNILAARLKSLEEVQIIEKSDLSQNKGKVLYRLTQKGIDLLPLIIEIDLWAEKYYEIPLEIKRMLEEVKRDKEAFLKREMGQL